MPKSTRQCLFETLEDLTEDELRKFKANLHEFPVKPGYDNIPRGRLQKADQLDLSDLLFRYYEDYALEVTAAVLKYCNCKPQAKKLASLSGIGNQPSSQPFIQPSTQPSSSSDEHFIDRFRKELIQRTNTLDQVLDKLYGSILNEEQYQKIRSETTEQDKMRELYKLVHGWERERKDQLYDALKSTDPFLIKDLEGR